MLSRLLSLWADNSTPLWIAWKRVNVCLNTSLMPTFPFFSMPSFAHNPPTQHGPPPPACGHRSLSDLITPLSDFIWPLPANQRPTSGWSPWQPTGPNILSLERWAEVCSEGGVGNEKYSQDWQLWWPEQSRTEAWMTLRCQCVFARMWVCTCYLISPESAAHPVDPVQWERVEWRVICASVYMCGSRSVETYRELQAAITLDTVYKYFYTQSFFFRGWREEVVLALHGPLGPPHRAAKLSCTSIALLTHLPVH